MVEIIEGVNQSNVFDVLRQRQEWIEKGVKLILKGIGEDPEREGLKDTPVRVAKAYMKLCEGYGKEPGEVLKTVFSEKYDEMVVLRDIEIFSLCEHHMLPFLGKAHVAYITNKKVVGLSKLARLVEVFARRLQIQERLTEQIADAMEEFLKPIGCGVVIEAKHLCMTMRGVEKQNSVMLTSAIRGAFKEKPGVKEEFFRMIGK